jgi:hypothetical protein
MSMENVGKILRDVYGPALERSMEADLRIGGLHDRLRDPRPIYGCLQKPVDVGELIRKLSEIDPNTVVCTLDGEHYDVEIVRKVTVHKDEPYFDGAPFVVIQ